MDDGNKLIDTATALGAQAARDADVAPPRVPTPPSVATPPSVPTPPSAGPVSQAAKVASVAAERATSLADDAEDTSQAGFSKFTEFVQEQLNVGGTPIEPVTYHFQMLDHEAIEWHVRRFSLKEALSAPYEVTVELVTDELDAPTDEMLGGRCELEFERGHIGRQVFGIITQLDHVRVFHDRLHVRATVVPAFKLLDQHVDTRFFQGASVIEILKEHLGKMLSAYDCELDTTSYIKADYNKRDFCSQFRESTFAFCSRLMEEEGITYFFAFDNDARREKLTLIDNNNDYRDVELRIDEEVPIIPGNFGVADRESIQHLEWSHRQQVNTVSSMGHNLKLPKAPDEMMALAGEEDDRYPHEVYIHGDRRQIIDDPVGDAQATSFTGGDLIQREAQAGKILQMHRARARVGMATSNAQFFAPGMKFMLGAHAHSGIDGQRFLVTTMRHAGDNPGIGLADDLGDRGDTNHEPYTNAFECIPAGTEFRPQKRTPKPRVYGAQTAKVVGPEGQEIHTDPLGRIKVRFFHDRISPSNDTASCWVRAAQSWAGPSWGTVFIPRVGMEVLVHFIDGNPDCPVVTGCVYNGENPLPYAMPDENTKSTIKTSSSPGGNGYNELTFEDAAGAEQIIVHAQKDYNETVENDHNTTVHHNQTIGVDANQTTSVGGNQTNTVTKDQTETVKENVTITVLGERSQNITKNETVTIEGARVLGVTKNQNTTVNGDVTETFAKTLTTTVGTGSSETISKGAKTIVVSAGDMGVSSSGKMTLSSSKTNLLQFDNSATLSTTGVMILKNSQCKVSAEGGKLTLSAADEIVLSCGSASIVLKKDGTVHVTGAKEAMIGSGGSALTLKPTEAGIKSPKISNEAAGEHIVKGALVKIN